MSACHRRLIANTRLIMKCLRSCRLISTETPPVTCRKGPREQPWNPAPLLKHRHQYFFLELSSDSCNTSNKNTGNSLSRKMLPMADLFSKVNNFIRMYTSLFLNQEGYPIQNVTFRFSYMHTYNRTIYIWIKPWEGFYSTKNWYTYTWGTYILKQNLCSS